jgi:hypothetical protein
MKYSKINQVVASINLVLGNQETKIQKKLFKFAEKIKPYQEEYMKQVDELRLDNASTDEKGFLLLNEKGEYNFTKEGIKKLTQDIKTLNDQEFEFTPIQVVNPQGLENFTFLQDWTSGIEFIKQEEEEL